MYEAIMIASTGIINQQRRLDTIADNVSNVNTDSFKTSRLDFKDALYTAGVSTGPVYSPDGNLQKGHGVMTAHISKDFSDGSLKVTGNSYDFALEGEGFFSVMDQNGNVFYTRGGSFYAAAGGDEMYLVTADGHFVLNAEGERITIPSGTTDMEVSGDGSITFTLGEEVTGTDRFGLYSFANRAGLSAAGGRNYEETIASGAPQLSSETKVNQGMLESSNVDMATEMTRLIRTQRAMSFASRALTTADDMEGIANNLRR